MVPTPVYESERDGRERTLLVALILPGLPRQQTLSEIEAFLNFGQPETQLIHIHVEGFGFD